MTTQMPPLQRAQVGEIELGYYEAGPRTGVPIVLCHGFPELAFSWRHQIKALAEGETLAIIFFAMFFAAIRY